MLTNKQKTFCDEYCIDLNATAAAIRAGYSKKTAYSIGSENLRKPEIKDFIKSKLNERAISAEETTKLIADIARGNLSDYLTAKRVEYTPRVERSLKELIFDLKKRIELEIEFKNVASLDEKEVKAHNRKVKELNQEVLRMELELQQDPKASRIVNDKTILVEVFELDMNKLVADKERGKIKSIVPGEFGVKVEIHDAHAALTNLARMHGLFEKDNYQQEKSIKVTIKKR
ncbi:MAG: terminase small subunit [Bacteroidia bacterium]